MKIREFWVRKRETMKVPGYDYENTSPGVDLKVELEEDESFATAFKKASALLSNAWETEASKQVEEFIETRKKG